MAHEQPTLFDPDSVAGKASGPVATEGAPLSAASSLAAAMRPFEQHMIQQGFTQHTINAFLGDMKLFMRHWGKRTALGALKAADLEGLLRWLEQERGVPCSPKSYARRVTTLKVFSPGSRRPGCSPPTWPRGWCRRPPPRRCRSSSTRTRWRRCWRSRGG